MTTASPEFKVKTGDQLLKEGKQIKTADLDGVEGQKIKWVSTGRACDYVRQMAKECLLNSDCIKNQKRSAKECVYAYDGSVPKKCYDLINTLGDCKHSMMDRRSRFRGRKGEIYEEDDEMA